MDGKTGNNYEFRNMNSFPNPDSPLYDNVRSRRIIAFLLDTVAIFSLTVLAYVVTVLFSYVTFGLGFFLVVLVWPVVALLYIGLTLGSESSATPGMRMVGIRMYHKRDDRIGFLRAVIHSILFWFSVSCLTPVVLIVSLFSDYKRLLHDIVMQTVVTNVESS